MEKVELRFALTVTGVLFVTLAGTTLMQEWSVESLVSLEMVRTICTLTVCCTLLSITLWQVLTSCLVLHTVATCAATDSLDCSIQIVYKHWWYNSLLKERQKL